MKKTFTIDTGEIKEQLLMESCLNQKYSGLDSRIMLLFYALNKSWYIDKLTYYMGLLKE